MCCFSQPVSFVGKTQIFARLTGTGSQFLAYEMVYESEVPNAMILPLPVLQSAGEDAVQFIDLSEDESFFKTLSKGFPRVPRSPGLGCGADRVTASADAMLPVQNVGNFIASFVPTIDDFDRLDPQFTIPKDTWLNIPEYADYGFAIFQLASLSAIAHPMAFEFQTRFKNDKVFFPTVHIHDGVVHKEEKFDHSLFLQHAAYDSVVSKYRDWNVTDAATGFVRSKNEASDFCQSIDNRDLIVPELLVHRLDLKGTLKNEDMVYSIEGDALTPSFNYRKYSWLAPWAVIAAGVAWFFNRRSRLKSKEQ